LLPPLRNTLNSFRSLKGSAYTFAVTWRQCCNSVTRPPRRVECLLDRFRLRRPPRHNCIREQPSQNDERDTGSQNPPLAR